MSLRHRIFSRTSEVGAVPGLLRQVAGLATLPADVCDDAVARGEWVEVADGSLGAEVSGRPVVLESGVLAIIGPDGRAQDLLGPGRLRAPNATHTLWPLAPTRLLVLPVDLLGALGGAGSDTLGPVVWGSSLATSIALPGLVVDREVPALEVVRRLDAMAGDVAAVTGMDAPAAIHRDTARAAGAASVGDLATPAPVIDAESPLIEVLTSLIAGGVPIAPLVSADVPVGAIGVDELPLPVGPAARAACDRTGRSSAVAVADLAGLGPAIAVELLDAGAEAASVARALTSITVEVVRRTVEGVADELGPPPARFAWLGFGSLARGEVLSDSDLDTGLAWEDDAGTTADAWFAALASRTCAQLRELGYHLDPGGVSADEPAWRHDLQGWRDAVRSWTDPRRREALVGAGVAADVRAVAGDLPADEMLRDVIGDRVTSSVAMATLAADALRRSTPRVLGRRVTWRSTALRRYLDLKRDLGAPIVDLARVHTLRRGGPELATFERLAAAAVDGDLEPRLAVALRDGFDLALRERLAQALGRSPMVASSGFGHELAPAMRALAIAQRGLRARHAVAGW